MNVLMVQGTTSDAGKSTLVAGLCRVFSDSNMSVAPFKPQNMALNSAVTEDGGEIGRAQALQAVAARVPAIVDFNPILLKPNSDTGAQVIVHGKALSNMEAGSYHDYKKVAMDAVLESHTRLSKQFDVLLVEGAGSPAEINLRENDIANMGYAEEVDCPVIIIADIDKGGVFAHLVGTLALLSQSEQDRVKGFVINRFRGDIALLQSGLDWLEQKTGKPVLGVLPYLHDLALDAEDAVNIANVTTKNEANKTSRVKACVLILPHISNHTDFDALRLNSDIDLEYVRIFDDLPECDLFILPGSKNVIGDLDLIKQQGWPQKLQRHLRYGGKLLGICGGFQMLGKELLDPEHIESSTSKTSGLNFADFTTTLTATKQLTQVTALSHLSHLSHLSKLPAETKDNTAQNTEQHADGVKLKGYEIHCGVSTGEALKTPAFMLQNKQQSDTSAFSPDGFISHDKQIIGTYIHGLFDSAEFTNELMTWVNPDFSANTLFDLDEHRETQLDRLAQCYREHLDIAKIKSIVGIE